jgi:hypothetical protein
VTQEATGCREEAHGQAYQAASAQLTAFHDQFVRALSTGAASYASAEAANASPLQTLEQQVLNLINAPSQAILVRPLIGDGTNGHGSGAGWRPGGAGASGGPGGIVCQGGQDG